MGMRVDKFIICTLFVSLATGVSYGQGQIIKYGKQALKYDRQALKQSFRELGAINPRLPFAIQQRIANGALLEGQDVLRQSLIGAEGSQSSLTPGTAPESFAPALESRLQEVPVISPHAPEGFKHMDFITGPQALETHLPQWQNRLLEFFTAEQINALAQTFRATDEALFELDEAGSWVRPRSQEWQYALRFRALLESNAVKFRPDQYTVLFGKFSVLDDVFTRLNLQSFIFVHKRSPRPSDPGMEGKLARHVNYNITKRDGNRMNPEVEEYIYGPLARRLSQSRGEVAQLWQETTAQLFPKKAVPTSGSRRAPSRTPAEILAQVKQFRQEHNGQNPSQTSAEPEEKSLRQAWRRVVYQYKDIAVEEIEDPVVQELVNLYRQTVQKQTANRTPEEVLAQVKQFRQEHNGQNPFYDSADPEEKSLRVAWAYIVLGKYKDIPVEEIEDPVAQELVNLYRQTVREVTADRTPEEVLAQVKQFRQEHDGQNPSVKSADSEEKSLRLAWQNVVYKYKDTSVEEIEDPVAQELVQLHRETVREYIDYRSPTEVLAQVKQFRQEHNGKNPSRRSADPEEKSLRVAWQNVVNKYKDTSVEEIADPVAQELVNLYRQTVRDVAAPRTPAEVLAQVQQFRQEHNGQNPSQTSAEPEEKSLRFAWQKVVYKYKDISVEEIADPVVRELVQLYRETIGVRN